MYGRRQAVDQGSTPRGGRGRRLRLAGGARRDARKKGHDRLATTEIYLNLSPEHVIKEFMEKW